MLFILQNTSRVNMPEMKVNRDPRRRTYATMGSVSSLDPATDMLLIKVLKISSLLSARSSKMSLSLTRRSLPQTETQAHSQDQTALPASNSYFTFSAVVRL